MRGSTEVGSPIERGAMRASAAWVLLLLFGCRSAPSTPELVRMDELIDDSWKVPIPEGFVPIAENRAALVAAAAPAERSLTEDVFALGDAKRQRGFIGPGSPYSFLGFLAGHIEGVCDRRDKLYRYQLDSGIARSGGVRRVGEYEWRIVYEEFPKLPRSVNFERCVDDYSWTVSLQAPPGEEESAEELLEIMLANAELRRGLPLEPAGRAASRPKTP